MTVLVDTTIWSLALRRRPQQLAPEEQALLAAWSDLVASGRCVLTGPIRQEILSGIRSEAAFHALQEQLSNFRYLEIFPADYDEAARFFNICRSHGIAGSHVDMLICATAYRYDVPIFTTDPDFSYYVQHLPLRLYKPGDRTPDHS